MTSTPVESKGGRENWRKEVLEWGAKLTLTETRTLKLEVTEMGLGHEGLEILQCWILSPKGSQEASTGRRARLKITRRE